VGVESFDQTLGLQAVNISNKKIPETSQILVFVLGIDLLQFE
jgi:hypothetical protein